VDITDQTIQALRGPKNRVDPTRPYAWLHELEATAAGLPEEVATIFLTNRECPFHCLYCDLWKNTTDDRVAPGMIPAQIDWALAHLPATRHIKLYNSGNFFDRQAIPPEDYPEIARRMARYQTVIVENHPRLVSDAVPRFRDLLVEEARRQGIATVPELEVALGLETVHPDILPRLNKQMILADFEHACRFLTSHGIALRAFILLAPPWMPLSECVDWALRSVTFAFDCGVRVCAVIPTRSGNGIMQTLEQEQQFVPPRLAHLEAVLDQGFPLARGRLLVDTWDLERLFACPHCSAPRAARLKRMNLTQQLLPPICCSCP
jgi:archaeosine synthase beta-subunit